MTKMRRGGLLDDKDEERRILSGSEYLFILWKHRKFEDSRFDGAYKELRASVVRT